MMVRHKDGGPEEATMSENETFTERIKVTGDNLLAKVREIVHEGNVRRVIIKNAEGRTLVEIPLTVGVVGVLLAPVAAAIGAIAALVKDCTIEVERDVGPKPDSVAPNEDK
jgi:hypothetical protein